MSVFNIPVLYTHDYRVGSREFCVKNTFRRFFRPSGVTHDLCVFTMSKEGGNTLIDYWNKGSEDWEYTLIAQALV